VAARLLGFKENLWSAAACRRFRPSQPTTKSLKREALPQIEIPAAHSVTFGLSPHFSVVTFHFFVMPPAVNDPPCCSTSSAYPRSAVTHEERNDEGSPFDCLSHTLSAPHRSCPTCPVPVLANRCFPSRTSNQNRRHTLRLSPKLVVEALCTPSSWGELGDET